VVLIKDLSVDRAATAELRKRLALEVAKAAE
jgi:hypothetical protein